MAGEICFEVPESGAEWWDGELWVAFSEAEVVDILVREARRRRGEEFKGRPVIKVDSGIHYLDGSLKCITIKVAFGKGDVDGQG